jgi:CRISPR-associated protein Csx10
MARLNIYLEAQGPLLLGDGVAVGNVKTSRPYVPGSMWRGAVADAILSARRGRRSFTGIDPALPREFQQVFLGEQPLRFGFLYPVRKSYREARGLNTFVLPLTARTCKQSDGFVPKGHGVFDSLRNQWRSVVTDGYHALPHCPQCKGRLERQRGSASRTHQQYAHEKVGTRSFVRVGLNRYTETAQDQVLYVLDALVPGPGGDGYEAPLTFVGACHGQPDQLKTLRSMLDEHLLPTDDGGYELRVGTARARGMGRVHLYVEETDSAAEPSTELMQRLDQFQEYNGAQQDSAYIYASLTLRSPLQLLENSGLYINRLEAETIRAYAQQIPQDLQIVHGASSIEHEMWPGWSNAWRLPKPNAPAVAAGSTFLIRTPAAERQAMIDFLTHVEQNGLGERRAEGWGDILVCDPFHLEYDENR